jgi:hypothetical protein
MGFAIASLINQVIKLFILDQIWYHELLSE